jgi:hypothetical protein
LLKQTKPKPKPKILGQVEIGLLKAETVNRHPSKPRPMPQLLQAETHAVAPPNRDLPVGFDENGSTEKRKKNGRERTENRGRAEETNGRERKYRDKRESCTVRINKNGERERKR